MSSELEKAARRLSAAAASLASLLKVALRSRRPSPALQSGRGELVILGNGPSLNDTLERHSRWLADKPKLAVNFAANSPLFPTLRPELYILADPVFFSPEADDKVASLWRAIFAADWPMTLLVPAPSLPLARSLLPEGSEVTLRSFNMTPVEGLRPLNHFLYRKGLGMPRPRNVLIPAIMEAIRMGYTGIYIAGADHSWSKTLWVDDSNRVVTVQPHFYPDDEAERQRVTSLYAGIHLHDIYQSFAIAFRSYFAIADYARTRGVSISNITPGSFIDAFPRFTPPED